MCGFSAVQICLSYRIRSKLPQAGRLTAAVSLYIVIIVTKWVSQFFDSRKKMEKDQAPLFLENRYVPFFESETAKRVLNVIC